MKLSIITINYNNADGLRKTMESVFAQTCKEFEYIVVDGASSDGSVNVIKEYVQKAKSQELRVKSVFWVSEPDTGIYNAMNKGLKMAHGEYTLMLNSGDFLIDEHVIEHIIPELHTEDMIQGNTIEEYSNTIIRNRGYARSDISFLDVMGANFLHQATFIKLSTMEQFGYYDESYRKGSDTYFFITALGLGNATYRYVDIDITNFDVNGITSDPKWQQIDKEEDARWFGSHISNRLSQHCNEASRAMQLYNTLHQSNLGWYIICLVVKMIRLIHPIQPVIKKEIVKG